MATGYKLPDGRDFDDVFPVISGGDKPPAISSRTVLI